MCGIVGYIGPKKPKDVILSGLKKLEYRGYDSAGVAILDENEFRVFKAEGKLSSLENKVEGVNFSGHIGIGHTRWATHGKPTEQNAHPHKALGVRLVHNGIIENYLELKTELQNQGVSFASETDTEIIAHLIAHEVEAGSNLLRAVQNVIPKLRGAYAVLVVDEREPEKIIAFKSGPPLIFGVSDAESVIASDALVIVDHVQNVVFLEDHEVACIEKGRFEIFSSTGHRLEREIVSIDIEAEQSDKKGHKHYMLKEIFEQPRAVASALEPYLDVDSGTVAMNNLGIDQAPTSSELLTKLKNIERVHIIACGTSFYAGLYGEYLIEELARLPVEVDIASEFRYRNPVLSKNSLVLVISQSGETADTLAALRLAKSRGLVTASLCNTKHSTIDRESDLHIYMGSGIEVGVASTKAFVSSLALLNLFALHLAKCRDAVIEEQEKEHIRSLLAIPSQMEGVLSYDKFFAQASQTLKKYRGFLYLGRGQNFPIAMEGALKLKELAYMHAEGYAAGEMKHGPLALIDDRMATVVISPKDRYYEKTISNLEEAKARGGVIISVGTGEDTHLKNLSEHYLALPEVPWYTSGLLSVIPVQLLSYHLADVLGHDVDQPRNLAKSVTVE